MAAVNSGAWRALSDAEPAPWRGGWKVAGKNRDRIRHSWKNFASPAHWSVTHKIKHENRKKWFWSWGGPSHPRSLWKTFSIHLRKWPFTSLVHMLAGGPEVGGQGRWLYNSELAWGRPELSAGFILNSARVVAGAEGMGRSVKASCHDGDVF